MPILINCGAKGCCKQNEAKLDLRDNEVYCELCGNKIPGVSPFTKNQMKMFKQIRRPAPSAYSIYCEDCKQKSLPKLENNILVCSWCSVICKNVSKPFETIIRDLIKKGEEEL